MLPHLFIVTVIAAAFDVIQTTVVSLLFLEKLMKQKRPGHVSVGISKRDTTGDCTSLCNALIQANEKIYLKDEGDICS